MNFSIFNSLIYSYLFPTCVLTHTFATLEMDNLEFHTPNNSLSFIIIIQNQDLTCHSTFLKKG